MFRDGNYIALTPQEARTICRMGQGKECCAYLVAGAKGFECARKTSLATTIDARLAMGSMNAQATGGWPGCAWEEKE